jgi:6-phosphogluconolactonase
MSAGAVRASDASNEHRRTKLQVEIGDGMAKSLWVRTAGAMGISAAMLLAGCNGFFVHPSDGGTSSGTTSGSSTSDYVYTINSDGTVGEFVVGSSTLTAIAGTGFTPGSPLSSASSIAVSLANTYVFVGGNGGVDSYSIGTNGELTAVSGGSVTEIANFISLALSPNGDYLLALDNIANVVWVFSIDPSTGVLTVANNYPVPVLASVATARNLAISPNGGLGAVAIGAGGSYVFTFDESNGAIVYTAAVAPANGYSDDSVTFDSTNGYVLIGRGITSSGTSEILPLVVTSAGAVGTSGTPYTTGQAPFALLLDTTGSYLYSANKGDSTVSGFSLKAGVLAALTGSPYESGPGVTALVEDINKTYVIAAAEGSATSAGDGDGLTLYAFDALNPGQLDAVGTADSGSYCVAIAATHPQ